MKKLTGLEHDMMTMCEEVVEKAMTAADAGLALAGEIRTMVKLFAAGDLERPWRCASL